MRKIKVAQPTICLICSHEIKLYNNDKQFSWDLHKQENYHVKTTRNGCKGQKGKKKMLTDKISEDVQAMTNFFGSNNYLSDLAANLEKEARKQLSNSKRNEKVCKAVALLFSKILDDKQITVILFGSRITGLSTKQTGDLDIFVDTSEGRETRVDEGWLLEKATRYMKNEFSSEWANVNPVLSCRTPILKALHFNTNLPCDITANNGLGVVNTQLMCLLLDNIPLLRQMILVIREWSSHCDFNNDLHNYALSLLVLYYLQNEGYAPSVDEFKYDYTGPIRVIDGYETLDYRYIDYNKCEVKSMENVTLKQLLIGFFEFYKVSIFRENVICPLLGKPVKKTLFENKGKKLPPEMHAYVQKEKLKQISDRDSFKIIKGICIQDPIDLGHNITKATSLQFMFDFTEMCRCTAKALQSLT